MFVRVTLLSVTVTLGRNTLSPGNGVYRAIGCVGGSSGNIICRVFALPDVYVLCVRGFASRNFSLLSRSNRTMQQATKPEANQYTSVIPVGLKHSPRTRVAKIRLHKVISNKCWSVTRNS